MNKSMVSHATLADYSFIKDEMSRVRKSIALTQQEQEKLEVVRKENNLDEETLIKNVSEILKRSMKIHKDVKYLIERLSKCISGSKFE
jgi:septal ring factor EnvC (AmiA/AmiB activator)